MVAAWRVRRCQLPVNVKTKPMIPKLVCNQRLVKAQIPREAKSNDEIRGRPRAIELEKQKRHPGAGCLFQIGDDSHAEPPCYFFNQLLSFPMLCLAAMGARFSWGFSLEQMRLSCTWYANADFQRVTTKNRYSFEIECASVAHNA